jgi:CheY-like chemotaxis protein
MHIFSVISDSFLRVTPNGANSFWPMPLLSGMRSILLVEDDANTRVTLRDFLTEAGYVVHAAREGQHALHMLEKMDLPDLILLDYKMPVMDGKQFLSVQRRNPRLENIPVVILSAATREWSGAHLEVEEVLSKPVDLELLLSTVNRICTPPTPDQPATSERL